MQLLLSPPAVEPVSLASARMQCRCDPDATSEDVRLLSFIQAARQMAEQETGQRFITQTWSQLLDVWPCDGAIELLQTPAIAVASVTYIDTTGSEQTLPPSAYRLSLRSPRSLLRLRSGQAWPSNVRMDGDAITVHYTVGFGDDPISVPASIREWILAHVNAMWENRGAVGGQGASFATLPYLARLLDPWRVYV